MCIDVCILTYVGACTLIYVFMHTCKYVFHVQFLNLGDISHDEAPMDKTLTNAVIERKYSVKALKHNFDPVPEKPDKWTIEKYKNFTMEVVSKHQKLPFLKYRLYSLAALVVFFLIFPGFLSGLLFGFYVSFICFLFVCVSDPIQPQSPPPDEITEEVKDFNSKECSLSRVYKGKIWTHCKIESYT